MKPWGGMDPNSTHQTWSRWTFVVRPHLAKAPLAEVKVNAARWLRSGFGSVGRARVEERFGSGVYEILIEAEVEGAPAQDPDYVASVRRQFGRFVTEGWGPGARASVSAKILAGEVPGRSASQLIVMPRFADGS